MGQREIPNQMVWGVLALIAVLAVFFLWNAGRVRTAARQGEPTAQDRQLLQQMQSAREKTGAGRALPRSAPAPAPTASPR